MNILALHNKKRELQLQFSTFQDYALSTFPDLKQEAHTYNFLGVPLTLQLTRLMFDFQTLFDLLCEWLTLIP